jgi:hypothetical protein
LNHRHQQLHRTCPVHLFADDAFDLADHAQPHGHVVVNARAQSFDKPSSHHQLMAHDLGIGGGFFEGGDKKLGGFHGRVAAGWFGGKVCTRRGGLGVQAA